MGTTFGPTAGLTVTQKRISEFASATDDHQWIHVDPERAGAGPFGTTIAHGYLTLSLIPHLLGTLVHVTGAEMGINYGLNKVRFPSPVPRDARITAWVEVVTVRQSSQSARVTFDVTLRSDGAAKPACVAQVVVLYVQ